MGKLAALSSNLLARKGQAKPAMRPQGFAGFTAPAEDLGWNDMGYDHGGAPVPPVLVERAALAAEIAPVAPPAQAELPATEEAKAPPVHKSVSVATATRIRRETSHKGKAAFTLRLDAHRHLQLRLASAIADESAQALMTQAFDEFLKTMPEVDALIAQLPLAKRR